MEYISDKKTIERAFIVFQLKLISLEALSGDKTLIVEMVENILNKICKGKNKAKMIRRCERVANLTMKPILHNEETINGHKFILMMHSLMQRIIDSGYIFPQFIIDIFEPFFEIEAKQQIAEADWTALKNSADKAAKKFHQNLSAEGYYI